jgi:hypothetical protein
MNAETARVSAMTLIAGAVITGLISLVQNVFYSSQDFSKEVHKPGFVTVSVLSLIGSALVIYGLPMVYARYAERWDLLAFTGVALMVFAFFLFSFFSFVTAIVVPFIAEKAPNLLQGGQSSGPPGFFPLVIIGTICTIVGPALLAASILTGRTPAARWIAYTLLVAAVLAIVGFFVGDRSGILFSLIGSLNLYVVLVAFVGLAYGLLAPSGERDRVARIGAARTG